MTTALEYQPWAATEHGVWTRRSNEFQHKIAISSEVVANLRDARLTWSRPCRIAGGRRAGSRPLPDEWSADWRYAAQDGFEDKQKMSHVVRPARRHQAWDYPSSAVAATAQHRPS